MPEAVGFGVEVGFVLRQPLDGIVEADGSAEIGLVGELEEDEGGDEGVFGGSADGDRRPCALVLLECCKIGDAAIDGGALAMVAHEGAETEGGDHEIAPAAVRFLGGDEGADEFLGQGVEALVQLVEADEGHGGCGDGVSELGHQAWGELEAGVKQLAGETVVLPGIPESVDLSDGLHGVSFPMNGVR